MSLRNIISVTMVLCLTYSIVAAPKYPFPQNGDYKYGIKATNGNESDMQAAYTIFVSNYYEENGNLARIKWDNKAQTVSEGIGYGMLIMVYMDNATNNTQSKFDKLWNYYQKWPNNNGLMHWKINGFTGVEEENGATDGDLDVALALTMAYAQWEDDKYRAAAKDLIDKIRDFEVDRDNYLKPGDVWDEEKNPSYLVTVALDIFKHVGEGTLWPEVLTTSYSLLKKCRNSSTGLVPNWCSKEGAPSSGEKGDYGYDAARTPWRMALAYAWHGHTDAKDIAAKMCSWIKSNTGSDPSAIASGYKLDGTKTENYNIPTFIGPFTCAGMVDASHQSWVNAGYDKLKTFTGDDNYYNESMQLLTMLLLTGNMENLYEKDPNKKYTIDITLSPAEGGTVSKDPDQAEYTKDTKVTLTAAPKDGYTFSGWSGDLTGTDLSTSFTIFFDMKVAANFVPEADPSLVDNCEDGDHLNRFGGTWYTYDDSANEGTSTIIPETSEDDKFKMTDGGYNSEKAVKISFELSKGNNEFDPFVGLGFGLNEDETEVDISDATGMTFYYKGDIGKTVCNVKVETSNITDWGFYEHELEIAADWTFITLNWDDFAQPSWADQVPFDRTLTIKIGWEFKGETGDKGEFWLDDVRMPGMDIVGNNNGSIVTGHSKEFSLSVIQPLLKVVIRYALQKSGTVKADLYDLKGNLMKKITAGHRSAGRHTESIDLSQTGISQGMYIVRLTTKSASFSDKLLICK